MHLIMTIRILPMSATRLWQFSQLRWQLLKRLVPRLVMYVRRFCWGLRPAAVLVWFWAGGIMMQAFTKQQPLVVLVPQLPWRFFMGWSAQLYRPHWALLAPGHLA